MTWRATRWLTAILLAVQPMAAMGHTFDVKQPEVVAGAIDIGLDSTFQRGVPHARGADLIRNAFEQSIDYGALPWWKVSAVLKLEKPEQRDARPNAVALENILVLKALREGQAIDTAVGWFSGIDVSIHAETTNVALFGPILSLKADKLAITVNPFLEKTFGRNREEGIALNYGWHAKYELRHGLAVGVEGFGVVENLGDAPPWQEQEHRLGPAVFAEVPITKDFSIAPDVGLLFGLTRATPDVALKLNVGIPLQKPPGKAGD